MKLVPAGIRKGTTAPGIPPPPVYLMMAIGDVRAEMAPFVYRFHSKAPLSAGGVVRQWRPRMYGEEGGLLLTPVLWGGGGVDRLWASGRKINHGSDVLSTMKLGECPRTGTWHATCHGENSRRRCKRPTKRDWDSLPTEYEGRRYCIHT